jgi:SAM-dependent methyltransferase
MFERIPFEHCPLCEHTSGDLVGTASVADHPLFSPSLPPTMRWVRCASCSHVFVDGYFSKEAFEVLFATANPSQLPGNGDVDRARQLSAKMVERVAAARGRPGGRWLDVGFGNGALLTTAAEFGFDCVGLDLRAEAVRRLQEFGYTAKLLALEHFEAEQPFEVISFADVLEHMPFPKLALAQAHRLLSPGGLLFVSMPNLDCFQWKMLDRAGTNPYWKELEHLHNFSRQVLYETLRRCDFEPVGYMVSERYVAGMEVLARRVPVSR